MTLAAKITDEPACGGGIRNRARIVNLEESDKKQWDSIENIKNRLPVWATFLFAVLTGIIAWLARGN